MGRAATELDATELDETEVAGRQREPAGISEPRDRVRAARHAGGHQDTVSAKRRIVATIVGFTRTVACRSGDDRRRYTTVAFQATKTPND